MVSDSGEAALPDPVPLHQGGGGGGGGGRVASGWGGAARPDPAPVPGGGWGGGTHPFSPGICRLIGLVLKSCS